MTTILAVRSPLMMLADSLCNDGDMRRLVKDKMHKILIPYDGDSLLYDYKIPQEGMPALVGSSGQTQSNAEFFYWCRQGLNKNTRPRFDEQHGINALLLLQSGVLLRFDNQCFPFEIEDNYYAVGSGREVVMGAVEAYIDWATNDNVCMPKNRYTGAMKIAAHLNIYTQEPIHAITLE